LIAAVVTTYKPDAGFEARLSPLLGVGATVIVSDNTPGGHDFGPLPEGFVVLRHGHNLGLAPALNAGLREAQRAGAGVVLLFDQDSTPSADFATAMLRALDDAAARFGPRCCVGPTHVDDGAPQRRRTAASAPSAPQRVSCLPTSGMTFRLGALGADDGFSDEFFLDLVDFEWCWRLGAQGWTFLRTPGVEMLHRLGVAERRFLGFTFHVPAPYRHYFQVRDTLRLARRRYVPAYSKLRLIGILPLKALVYPFILDRGWERLSWMARGLRDFARDVGGIGAAAARLSR